MESADTLETALRRAVNPSHEELDISAIDSFCLILDNDPKLINLATRLLAAKVQSDNPKEAVLALDALEECMDSCGDMFRVEINKFKFLNELIKLVSKKHNGNKTPKEVSDRILNILLTWTNKYEDLLKIKEAYSLLQTQGIEHEPAKNIIGIKNQGKVENKKKSDDDKDALKLKKLLQSNKPEDRQKANLMIQNFYREDERKQLMKNRRITELQKVTENTTLLNEMLDQYKIGETSDDELAIIKEIHRTCDDLHPTVLRLARETQQSEGMLDQILQANDNLTMVLDRYKRVVLNSESNSISSHHTAATTNTSNSDILNTLFNIPSIPSSNNNGTDDSKINLEELSELFSSPPSLAGASIPVTQHLNSTTILTPLVIKNNASEDQKQIDKVNEIKVLLNANAKPTPAAKNNYHALADFENTLKTQKVAVNNSSKTNNFSPKLESPQAHSKTIPDLESLISGMKSSLLPSATIEVEKKKVIPRVEESEVEDDEILEDVQQIPIVVPLISKSPEMKKEFKSLAEIIIDLDNIQPSNECPRTVLDENGGIKVTLNFAKDHPRPDVTVVVISTINQGRESITNYQFDASVPKPCKLRLLEASGTSLAGIKPFRPPADGITQVLLLSNPTQTSCDMTCILTFCVGDDPDPMKESIVVKDLPQHCN